MKRSRGAQLLALALFAATAVTAVAQQPVVRDRAPKGHLILIGGGEKPAKVMETFIRLAGGEQGKIVVLPTASGEPDTGDYYRELLQKHGAGSVQVLDIRSPEQTAEPEVVTQLEEADGIFFSGGDQRRITAALLGTPALDAIRRAFRRGAAIGGTSAGTACMSPLMITGDGDFDRVTADNVKLTEGLGLFPGAILDQHFVARQRQNRLLSVTLEHPDLLGIGIDEATAVWRRPDGSLEILGRGSVLIYDARGQTAHRRPSTIGGDPVVMVGGHDLKLHVLLPGDTFDPELGRPFRPSTSKASAP